MTHKAIRYSTHASQRMQLRGVRRADVRRAIATGVITYAAEADGVHVAAIPVRGERLIVQYKESATGLFIITVYFETR